MEYEVVRNINLLKKFRDKGWVKFCRQTGMKIHGLYDRKLFTCVYVDEVPKRFTYRGDEYDEKYFDGCFYPYVIRIIKPLS